MALIPIGDRRPDNVEEVYSWQCIAESAPRQTTNDRLRAELGKLRAEWVAQQRIPAAAPYVPEPSYAERREEIARRREPRLGCARWQP